MIIHFKSLQTECNITTVEVNKLISSMSCEVIFYNVCANFQNCKELLWSIGVDQHMLQSKLTKIYLNNIICCQVYPKFNLQLG